MNDERKKREQAPALHRLARIRPRLAILLALALALAPARGAQVQFTLADFTSTAVTNRKVVVSPATVGTNGTTVFALDKRLFITDTNGQYTLSNVVAGQYAVEILAPPAATRFFIEVPSATGSVTASTLVIAGITAPSSSCNTNGLAPTNWPGFQPATPALTNWNAVDTNQVAPMAHAHDTNQPANPNLTNWAQVSPDSYPTANTVQGWDDEIYEYADIIGGMLSGYLTNFGGYATNLFVQSPTLTQPIRLGLSASNRVLVIDSDGMVEAETDATYLQGLTGNLQTNLDARLPISGTNSLVATNNTGRYPLTILHPTGGTNYQIDLAQPARYIAATNDICLTGTIGRLVGWEQVVSLTIWPGGTNRVVTWSGNWRHLASNSLGATSFTVTNGRVARVSIAHVGFTDSETNTLFGGVNP